VSSSQARSVFGFYSSLEHAQEALKALRKSGFQRSAIAQRSSDGVLALHGGVPAARWLAMAAACLLAALIANALRFDAILLMSAAALAAAGGWLLAPALGLAVSNRVVRRAARFVLPGESLVVIQESEARTSDAIGALRSNGLPSVFALRPDFQSGRLTAAFVAPPEPVPTATLPQYAEELAATHVAKTARSRSLLPLVKEIQQAIESARADLAEAARLDYGISHPAQWLLDNVYLIRSHLAEIRQNLPDNHNRILPVIAGDNIPVQVRIYHVAADLVGRVAYRVTAESITSYLTAYQRRMPLTIAELWVFPLMLRLVLLRILQRLSESAGFRQHEKEKADFWANRVLNAVHQGPEAFQRAVTELNRDEDELTPHFIARLGEQLHKDESALWPIQQWIEAKTGVHLADTILTDHAEEANDLLSISTAIGSLRHLSELQYPKIVEAVSVMESILRHDPSGIHGRSDFDTRDRCRRVVEESARQSSTAEWDVARRAVELARAAAPGTREGCVAFYLIDDGRRQLERSINSRVAWRVRRLRFIYRHAALVYLGSITAFTAAVAGTFLFAAARAGVSPILLAVLGALAILPLSELAIYSVQMLLTLSLPPRLLPKMSYDEGIPDDCRTLVVIPMMLLTPAAIRGEIDKLEVRFLANPLPNLYFSLFADFTDATEPEMPEDDDLLGLAVSGIERLNAVHGEGRFVLLNRQRAWCKTENRWIGWERKRGKLEELNRFLNGEELGHLVQAGSAPPAIRYVITLDADTQLPHGSALRLIETISHPLNAVELSPDRRNRMRGYSIIQPRVSITLPSATASRFSRLFTDAKGADPYCQAVSDLYQDLFGEAIYHGKGIYDVQAFHHILSARFPEQRLLSHDLIEGSYVGVGLATDIELFEQFPYDYTSYSKRQHRWIRGDWQIASWILPTVPEGTPTRRVRNPLTLINRWKIFDNLRRSLVPPGVLLLLMISWTFYAAPLFASTLVGLVLLVPLTIQLLRRLANRWQGDTGALAEASSDLNRAVVMAAFLPHQAYLALDAVGRALYRVYVSLRHLLEWQTAEMSHLAARAHVDAFRAQFTLISLLAAMFLLLLDIRGRLWEPAWAPFLLLWVGAPAIQHWIGWQRRAVRRLEEIEPADQRYLRRIARETWRYFDDLVSVEHNWLPPDNTQEALRVETAARTSPTNIGMWLMSAVSANDLGFLTPEQLIERCSATLETMKKLERFDGHPLNWYDTRTLAPLAPHYVSTVDNGNLIASLWVLSHSCEDLAKERLLESRAQRGLADTLTVLAQRFPADHSSIVPIETLRGLFQKESSGIEVADRIRLAVEPVRKLAQSLRWSTVEADERTYWVRRLNDQIEAWLSFFDRYMRWADVLAAPPDEFVRPLGEEFVLERRRLLLALPSWRELADAEGGLLQQLPHLEAQDAPPHLQAWLAEVRSEIGSAARNAQGLLASAEQLARSSEDYAASLDMGVLYDSDRRLFGIGHETGAPREFTSHYDLLASESRLTSLIAIAKNDVPVEHWLALGRPYTTSDGQVLLSWSGTMFEYLMPLLFTRSFRNSLLENACAVAVKRQIEYGRERGVPWGISECAYSRVDIHKIYQYQAFGVPSLGLKRGLEDDLVVAPYATVLALLVEPVEAVRNLRRLEESGLFGRMGFYEAIDYTRDRERQGGKGVIVYAYMGHHQGMTLMALNNVLNGGILRRRFHADRRIQAVEPLLFERIPPQPSLLVHQPSDHAAVRSLAAAPAPAYRVFDEDTPVPRAHLLSNGRYSLMITNSGGGYSRWHDFEITRWRGDTTRDNWGTYFYLREEDSKALWSATHQPVGAKDPRYTATFSPERAEFRRRRRGIETYLEVIVSPDDDVEVRRLTVMNHTLRARKLELFSAAELSLALHDADRAHPAFNKLFIQTEARPELQALLAWRRLRSEDEPPIWVAQFSIGGAIQNAAFEYETSRATFLGRGRTWQNPALETEQNAGFVLDPIFAMKQRLDLEPRQKTQITLITAAASSREELFRLIGKYREKETAGRSFELAWSHAQLEYRYLDLQGDAAFHFGELASHLLYPSGRLRTPPERLRRNILGQSRLWAYGISGDLPLAVVSVNDAEGLPLAREVLIAHTYWRLHGLKADLLILNREPASYDRPLHQQLMRLIEAHTLHTGIDQPGGVFLLNADQIPAEDLDLILTVARVTLGTVRGPLSKQLAGSIVEGGPLPPLLQTGAADEQPSPPLPFLELPYFNGVGGFTPDGREYAIYLGPNVTPPLPWINVMANPVFGQLVSESGSGCCWFGNSQSNRLTPWSNDPISDPSTDAVYIRDEDSGVFWTPTPLPVRELDAYRTRHGQGYTEFEHNSHALEQTLLTFVPQRGGQSDPIRIQRLRIKNRSSRPRRLSVTAYSELVLGTDREVTQPFIVSSWDENMKSLLARNSYHRDYGRRVTFAAVTPDAASYTGDRSEFLGRNGSPVAPAALRRLSLSNRTGPALDPCAALQTKFEIAPWQEKTVILLLGQADDLSQARSLVQRYRDLRVVEQAFAETRQWWDGLLSTVQVQTPVLSVNLLMNRWLLYQSLSCRIWGRTALYQSSGGFGFRDQLQDSLAFVYAAPGIARAMILQAAARQFVEGDVQHWWHLPSGQGIRTRCSDDLLWLPYAVCQYVEITADTSILDESVNYLLGPVLREGEVETFFEPTVAAEKASLFDHCLRALEKGATAGPHGLPLIGSCDWNDGMNRVGPQGKGESVWLGWFVVDIWNRFARLCDSRGDRQSAEGFRNRAVELSATIERTAWDGKWYRRAYFDDGTPIGSAENSEAQIDSLPQSWSVISGAAKPDRAAQAMQSVEKHLVRKQDKLVLLFTPPFDQSLPHPGYIRAYPPGVRENGGQYTHAALWVAMAFVRMRDAARAVDILQMLNPVEHARTPEEFSKYETEPYAVAADVYSVEKQTGRGGWSWYTGSAGWMYRVWLEEVLGFKLRGNRLTIQPTIPDDWPGYAIDFRYGRTAYHIEVDNSLEGSGGEVLLEEDGEKHTLQFSVGKPSPRENRLARNPPAMV
jgi:cyclic beta-1,2-glucan synthetase